MLLVVKRYYIKDGIVDIVLKFNMNLFVILFNVFLISYDKVILRFRKCLFYLLFCLIY